MSKNLSDILKKADPEGEIFTESVQKQIADVISKKMASTKEESFKQASDTYEAKLKKIDESHAKKLRMIVEAVDSKNTAQLKKYAEKVDKDHSSKLSKLVEAIDNNHTAKLKKIVESIDADHTAKLEKLKKHYDTKYEKQLVESVDDYLDTYLKELTPKQKVVDTAKLKRYQQLFESVKNLFVEHTITESANGAVKEAIIEAKQTIDEKSKEVNKLIVEKVELTKKMKRMEAKHLLESKIVHLSPSAKDYMTKYFADADKKVITESFDKVLKAFKADKSEKRQAIVESNKDKGTKVVKPIMESKKVVTESIEDSDPTMDMYASRVQGSVSARK